MTSSEIAPRALWLGQQPYEPVWQAMLAYTAQRGDRSRDQFWCLEHDPVYTLGRAGNPAHILQNTDIPIVQSDRGGQVTYHGPGQLVIYPLLDLQRLGLGTRSLVEKIEQAMIDLCARYDVQAQGNRDAPGVYVEERKIGSLGLRISRQCSLHGLSLNINMDLSPFLSINPCGYQGLNMTSLGKESKMNATAADIAPELVLMLCTHLGLEECTVKDAALADLSIQADHT